ncbi:leucine-rich repeat flightless-interacting protein 1-like isoform X1 [Littorina saxatilis]|uniref:leucine-rich repeat flightless-interacting protein 1-like isoform X1 n=1 Tax=Littorina saxatilis TaxID=31220 RepID=UPI0038B62C23
MSRRRPNVRQYSAEDQALTDISKEAENRLAAKRAARNEAREIRMKEIERQQKEVEEKEKHGNTTSDGPSRIRPAASTGSSRRGSDDSSEGGGDSISSKERDVKKELRGLEDRYKQAMMTSAQLDNEKQSLVYNLELLKDQLEEQAEGFTELQREYKDKHRDLELTKRELQAVKLELKGLREQNDYKDRLIAESGLVIVAAENGELALERSKEAPSSNGPIGTGGLLLSSESLDLLNKGREGSLGTHSLASSPPSASHSTHPLPTTTTTTLPSASQAAPEEPRAGSDDLDGSSVDGVSLLEGSSVDLVGSSACLASKDGGGGGDTDTVSAVSDAGSHSPGANSSLNSPNASSGVKNEDSSSELTEKVQGSDGAGDESVLVGMLSTSHDEDNSCCTDDTQEGTDRENSGKSDANLQGEGSDLPSVIITGCSHSQGVDTPESDAEDEDGGDEFYDAVSTPLPSPLDPGARFEVVEGVSTGESSTDAVAGEGVTESQVDKGDNDKASVVGEGREERGEMDDKDVVGGAEDKSGESCTDTVAEEGVLQSQVDEGGDDEASGGGEGGGSEKGGEVEDKDEVEVAEEKSGNLGKDAEGEKDVGNEEKNDGGGVENINSGETVETDQPDEAKENKTEATEKDIEGRGTGVEKETEGGDDDTTEASLADRAEEGGGNDLDENVDGSVAAVSAEEKGGSDVDVCVEEKVADTQHEQSSQDDTNASLGGGASDSASSKPFEKGDEESDDVSNKGEGAMVVDTDECEKEESLRGENESGEQDTGEPSSGSDLKETMDTSDIPSASASMTDLDEKKAGEGTEEATIAGKAQDKKENEAEIEESSPEETQPETTQGGFTDKAGEANVGEIADDAEDSESKTEKDTSAAKNSDDLPDTLSPLLDNRKPQNRDLSEGGTSDGSEALLGDDGYDFDDIDEALTDGSPKASKDKGQGEKNDLEGDAVSFGSKDSGLQESMSNKELEANKGDGASFGSRDSGLQEGKESEGVQEDTVSVQSRDSGAGGVTGAEGGSPGVVGSRESLDLEAKLDKLQASQDASPASPSAKDKHAHKKSKFKRFKNIFK